MIQKVFINKASVLLQSSLFFLRKNKSTILSMSLLGGLFPVLLFIYGFWPGFTNNLSTNFGSVGNVLCLQNGGLEQIFSFCSNVGYPVGAPFVGGLPIIYLRYFIAELFSISAQAAVTLGNALVLLAAFSGAVALLRQLKVQMHLSIIFAFFYLFSYAIYEHVAFGATMYGFALLPAYAFIGLGLYKSLESKMIGKSFAFWLAAYVITRSSAIFLDGYTFVMSSLVDAGLLIAFAIQNRKHTKRWLLAAAAFVISNGVAFFLYKAYLPKGTGFSVMNIDFFRASGADIIAFFLPPSSQTSLYFLNALGLNKFLADYKTFGDGSYVHFGYLGYVLLVALILFFILKFKKSAYLWALIGVGFVGLFLSLGPSLKINSQNYGGVQGNITYESYLMPSSAATFDLKTDFIYEKIPGIQNMRAVYRWHTLFRFVLIVAAALVATYLLKKKKFWIVAALIILIFVEFTPNFQSLSINHANNYAALKQFKQSLITDLKSATNKNERVHFLSSGNDFLAQFLAGSADVRAYNVGGDKNIELARAGWPETIKNIRAGTDVTENIQLAFEKDQIDVLVVPFFSLRQHSYRWPPTTEEKTDLEDRRIPLVVPLDESLEIEKFEWFWIIRQS